MATVPDWSSFSITTLGQSGTVAIRGTPIGHSVCNTANMPEIDV
jgi:hypothetical protein